MDKLIGPDSLPTFMITLDDIRAAQARLQGVTVHTRLIEYKLGESDPRRLFLKPENQQPIGAFKLRGAYNKISSLSDADRKRGVITYSSGNHAQGVAYAARAVGAKAVIVMPENAPVIKREATAALGAEIVYVGAASADRRLKAEELEAKFGYAMVPPYDDPAIIAGQGTCGLEILEQLQEQLGEQTREAAGEGLLVLSPVSGGGLLSGIATAVELD